MTLRAIFGRPELGVGGPSREGQVPFRRERRHEGDEGLLAHAIQNGIEADVDVLVRRGIGQDHPHGHFGERSGEVATEIALAFVDDPFQVAAPVRAGVERAHHGEEGRDNELPKGRLGHIASEPFPIRKMCTFNSNTKERRVKLKRPERTQRLTPQDVKEA